MEYIKTLYKNVFTKIIHTFRDITWPIKNIFYIRVHASKKIIFFNTIKINHTTEIGVCTNINLMTKKEKN